MEENHQQGALETDSSRREDKRFIVTERSSSGRQSDIGIKTDLSSKNLEEIVVAVEEAVIDSEQIKVLMRTMPKR